MMKGVLALEGENITVNLGGAQSFILLFAARKAR